MMMTKMIPKQILKRMMMEKTTMVQELARVELPKTQESELTRMMLV